MKKVALSSLIWLRRIIFILLGVLIVLGLVLYFTANSALVVKKAADTFAKDYNISYDAIKGSALEGIALSSPSYKGEVLAKELKLKWNPNTLPAKIITVKKLHIVGGNMDAVKMLIASFSKESNESSQESNESSFDFRVDVDDIEITLTPFTQNGVEVSKAMLKSKSLAYDKDTLDVEDLELELDTNVTNVSLKGSMKERVATLDHFTFEDINVTSLLAFVSDDNRTHETEERSEKEGENTFIPKHVTLKTFKSNLLAFNYDPVHVHEVMLKGNNISFDVEKLELQEANLELNGTTNLSNIHYVGGAKNNHLLGQINLKPNNRLYELYALPLRKEAIGNIAIDLNASTDVVHAEVRANAKHILEGKKGEFNVDVEQMRSLVSYEIGTNILDIETDAVISTPYAKDIALHNIFKMDENISYRGEIKADKIIGFDEKLTKPLEKITVVYEGSDTSLQTTLETNILKGTFDSKNFKKGDLHLETKKSVMLDQIIPLPKELKETKVDLMVDAPIIFDDLSTIVADVKLGSNVVNLDAKVSYGQEVDVDGVLDIPEETLLKAYNQTLKWKNLRAIPTKVKISDSTLSLKMDAKALKSDLTYQRQSGRVDGVLALGGLKSFISGDIDKKLRIQTSITSTKMLAKELSTLYPLEELPPLSGKIDATLEVDALKSAALTLRAPKLIYQADRKIKHKIDDVMLVASMDASRILLKSYKATFNKQKYFSNKPATITLGDAIEVDNLWINDELQITGNYLTASNQGNFKAKAKKFHIKDKLADIYAKIDLDVSLDGNDTTATGKVILLGGEVKPNLNSARTFASDSDIIILQELKKKKNSPFTDNLALAVKIETQKPLRIKQKPMNVQLKPDFSINKEKGAELLYLGSVELLKGGSYIFQKKRFVLGKSFVHFTGDVNKPLLDIKANYRAINHLITISVTGTPATPNINFSSSPSLSREQILSVILFDSEAGGDAHTGEEMMKMMGGAMAKAALSDVGIDVDHLAFGEGNSVEVGKKISNKATVIYVNDEIPKVKLKYQHGKRTESVIQVSEESQSYDIIYKRDF